MQSTTHEPHPQLSLEIGNEAEPEWEMVPLSNIEPPRLHGAVFQSIRIDGKPRVLYELGPPAGS